MNLKHVDGLLQVSMQITYQGRKQLIDKLVIDTGAVHTIISADAVADIGIFFQDGDKLISMKGIGGTEYSFRKEVESICFDAIEINQIKLDFGTLEGFDINGLIGLDILLVNGFIINLNDLTLEVSK